MSHELRATPLPSVLKVMVPMKESGVAELIVVPLLRG
jgi:hypothetical protein